jgi:hypothetical protein
VVRSGPSATQASGTGPGAGTGRHSPQKLESSHVVGATYTVGTDAPNHAAPTSTPQNTPPAVTAAYGHRPINLLALIDPDKHNLGGNWRKENGELISDHSTRAKVYIPYKPPAEYDFKIEFTRLGIDNCVTQMFTHKKSAALILGGWKGTASGFQQLGGKSANSNSTTVLGIKWQAGKRHTSIVKVRKDGIEAWLDGERICVYATDGSDLFNRDWPINEASLGVGSEVSPTVFHTIELIEIPK